MLLKNKLWKKSRKIIIPLGVILGLLLAGWLIYQIPAVNYRLGWRLDIAATYVRTLFEPVKPLPSPIVVTSKLATPVLEETPLPQNPPTEVATTPALTPEVTETPPALPEKVVLTPPPYDPQKDKQDWNNCGPASLALYLRYYGWTGDQFTISDVVKPVRDDKNVNVDELTGFVHTQVPALAAEYRVGGTVDLLRDLIAHQFPVMIEEAFILADTSYPGDDHWSGHYLMLTSYDDKNRVFLGQDTFLGPDRQVRYLELDKNWQAFNRVFILIYPPDKQNDIQNILGDNWNVDQNRTNALATAKAETKSDPNNPYAWFNLGTNQVYFEDYIDAVSAYDQSRKLGWPQRMLRYQFGPFIADFHSNRLDDLLSLTDYALQRTTDSEEALIWRGWALYRTGDREGALKSFEAARKSNPHSSDVKYALDFLANNP
jgi:hypothetical protein